MEDRRGHGLCDIHGRLVESGDLYLAWHEDEHLGVDLDEDEENGHDVDDDHVGEVDGIPLDLDVEKGHL